jgi:imidazolonepropionase-like amidohydrolase
MKIRLLFIFYLSILLSLFCTCKKSTNPIASHGNIALINGTLIDGTGADPIADAAIVIENEIITAFGKLSEIGLPSDADIIDMKGATILPGFFNAHVHQAYNENNLKTWAQSGVTTVRELGGNLQNDLFAFRDRVNKNPQCARLVAAGPIVTVPDGYPTIPFGASYSFYVTSTEDARQKVNQLLDDGADLIKIALESGVIFGQTIAMLSPEEAAAIVDVAHQWNTVVSAHVTVSQDLSKALDAGVDDIAHMVVDNLPDNLIQRMIADDVYWVPTLELWYGSGQLGSAATDNLGKFFKAGGKVALGTDYAGYTCPFDLGMPIREIKWMIGAGMTPMQVIVAATKNAAHVCNLESELGTLKVGKTADVLVVNGNPLEDIDALLNVHMVIHGGEIIREENR